MWTYNYSDELRHYGVLGMKWGVRRARKKGKTYSYKSSITKSYEKKAAKAKQAGKTDKYIKINKKAKSSAEFDKKLQSEAEAMNAGKTALSVFLNGTVGTKTYAAAKAYGSSEAGAWMSSTVMNYMAGPVGNMVLTDVYRADYIRKNK